MSASQVRALERQLAEQVVENAKLRRLILDGAVTKPGLLALLGTGGNSSEGESGA